MTATEIASRRSLRRVLRGLTPEGAHYAVLMLGAVVLLAISTRLWFFYDDWALLVPSLGNIWAPHVGHWTTGPALIFAGLRGVFGIDSFVPFALPVLFAHLAVAHLVWRIMIRIGVLPWFATAFSVLLTFFGAGAENILWAFQVGFVGAMGLMLAIVVLALRPRFGPRSVVASAALALVAMTFSGTALPLLAVVAVLVWWRHRLPRTLAVIVPAVVAFGAWYLVEGRFAAPVGRAVGLQILSEVPTFAINMLADGLGRAFPVAVLGVLIFLATAIWGVLSFLDAPAAAKPAYLLFLAAPLFALLTGYSRVGLGLDTATSSRYLYFVIPMMLPLMALGLSRLTELWNLRRGAVVVLILVLAAYNLGGLAVSLAERRAIVIETRERMNAAAALVVAGTDIDPTARPDPRWMPDVTMSDVERFVDEGWLTPVGPSAAADWKVRLAVGLGVESSVEPATESGCRPLAPGDPALELAEGESPLIRADQPVSLELGLVTVAPDPAPQATTMLEGWSRLVTMPPPGSRITLASPSSAILVCGR